MNKKQLTVAMLMLAYFSSTYGMEQEIEQPTAPELNQLTPTKDSYIKNTDCEEQQYWLVELHKAYHEPYLLPFNKQSRRFKKMFNTLPLDKKEQIAALMVEKHMIKSIDLDEDQELTLHEAALMKKNDWTYGKTLVVCGNNLLPRTLNLKAFEQSKSNKSEDIFEALFLQQLSTISEQRCAGTKLHKLVKFVAKTYVEQKAAHIAGSMTHD